MMAAIMAWLARKAAGFAFGRFITKAGPVILPVLVLAVAVGFVVVQERKITRLTLEVTLLKDDLATCNQNVSDVLRDKIRDDEIENLSDDDLLRRAIDRGWLREGNVDSAPNGSSLLPD